MQFNGKRPAGSVQVLAKAARPDEEGEQWACPKCGNMNYPSRSFCNMRKCQAPRPNGQTPTENWTCPGCGNENYASRLFCNIRRCQQAKPGLTLTELKQSEQRSMSMPMSMQAPLTNGGANGSPPAWTCPACGNQNYPGRWKCNTNKCSRPYPGTPYSGMMQQSPMGAQYQQSPMGALQMLPTYMPKPAKKERPPPDGSWVCVSCKNVNFPTRDTCNKKSCNLPRHVADGGPPEPQAPKPQLPVPEGAWTCVCGNVNWPTRTVCNRRACQLPKPPA